MCWTVATHPDCTVAKLLPFLSTGLNSKQRSYVPDTCATLHHKLYCLTAPIKIYFWVDKVFHMKNFLGLMHMKHRNVSYWSTVRHPMRPYCTFICNLFYMSKERLFFTPTRKKWWHAPSHGALQRYSPLKSLLFTIPKSNHSVHGLQGYVQTSVIPCWNFWHKKSVFF